MACYWWKRIRRTWQK